jgi:hypothetical protein
MKLNKDMVIKSESMNGKKFFDALGTCGIFLRSKEPRGCDNFE